MFDDTNDFHMFRYFWHLLDIRHLIPMNRIIAKLSQHLNVFDITSFTKYRNDLFPPSKYLQRKRKNEQN